ncbi:hypothetical protein GCM10009118_24780 [Wandonia haliotis]|uniref:Uncharacterized protein n=1 Tax=Wandonia haliotis TaxID=574963 RepID=A0ABP3Y5X2_9FLAO
MTENFILLKDVQQQSLHDVVVELVHAMQISSADVYTNDTESEFIIAFPEGITNELFVFFYSALMAPDLTNSKDLVGWFYANDELTLDKETGDFSQFSSESYTKLVQLLPDGDDRGSSHQYAISENGKEIHFGMDGTYKVMHETGYQFQPPVWDASRFVKIASIRSDRQEEKKTSGKGCLLVLSAVIVISLWCMR